MILVLQCKIPVFREGCRTDYPHVLKIEGQGMSTSETINIRYSCDAFCIKKKLITTLVCVASQLVIAAPASMILMCDGTSTEQGRNAPKWVPYAPPASMTETFAINGNRLTSKDVLLFKVEFTLCRESATEYIFSSNCKVEPLSYMRRWLGMTDSKLAQQDMLRVYGENWTPVETIHIDRINLTVDDLHLNPAFDPIPDKGVVGDGKADYSGQFYFSLTQFRGTCKLAKATI